MNAPSSEGLVAASLQAEPLANAAEGIASPAAADGVDPAAASSDSEPVSAAELNSWRRGFTPQAEIWNGRLAMLGLSVGLTLLLLGRLWAG
jgi:hypothetical protein